MPARWGGGACALGRRAQSFPGRGAAPRLRSCRAASRFWPVERGSVRGVEIPAARRRCAMEGRAAAGEGGEGARERRGLGEAARPQQNYQVQPQAAAAGFPKHSYWLDLWLFVLVDLALFLFVYLLPW